MTIIIKKIRYIYFNRTILEKKKYRIVQFVEAFGGGVYTYVKDLSNFLLINQNLKFI